MTASMPVGGWQQAVANSGTPWVGVLMIVGVWALVGVRANARLWDERDGDDQ